jgi:uncharacterized protein with PQ loop repeat
MTLHEIPQDALGFAAGVLTTIAFAPQVYRIVRTRSAHDIYVADVRCLQHGESCCGSGTAFASTRCR